MLTPLLTPGLTPGPTPILGGLYFTNGGLDRAPDRRRDEKWVAGLLADRTTEVIPVWRNRNLVTAGTPEAPPAARTLSGEPARGLLRIAGEVALLGLGGRAYFAADVSGHEMPALAAIMGDGEFVDLRDIGSVMDHRQAALLAYARGLMFWHRRHRHCGACGGPTDSRHGGHLRLCVNADCAIEHFPGTDPAVIMLVTRPGPDGGACLMGRQKSWTEGMYSALAGFVDPGESLEEAVAREVWEETGVAVADVTYRASQPWPFPSSLMLGFRARATSVEITIDDDELEDAQWFTKDQIARFAEQGRRLPRPVSIARWLIDQWLAEDGR